MSDSLLELRQGIGSPATSPRLEHRILPDIHSPSRPPSAVDTSSDDAADLFPLSQLPSSSSGDALPSVRLSSCLSPGGRKLSCEIVRGRPQSANDEGNGGSIAAVIRRLQKNKTDEEAGLRQSDDGGVSALIQIGSDAAGAFDSFEGSSRQLHSENMINLMDCKRVSHCITIPTDGTLMMSALEAGEVMIVKDSLVYLGRKRLVRANGLAGDMCMMPFTYNNVF